MASLQPACRGSIVAVAVLVVAASAAALGRPDWAKPFLQRPTPTGGYIAKNDKWVIVYGEVELAPRGRGIEQRHRLIIENLSEQDETFETLLAYDEGMQELSNLALNVERLLWHEINLNKKAIRASVKDSAQVLIAGAESIAPHRRVVFEYTLGDKLGLNPWSVVMIPRELPTAEIKYYLSPDSAAAGVRMQMRVAGGGAPPGGFTAAPDGSWTVRNVPGSNRLNTANLVYQPAETELFPYVLANRGESGPASFRHYAKSYGEAWNERVRGIAASQVQATAAELTKGDTAVSDKALHLTNFVQHRIQYDDSNEKSTDSWLPIVTQETLRTMKADCKGKVMLLQALLRAVGIESTPLLLRSDRDYFAWDSEVGTAFFNHVVLAVKLPGIVGADAATLTEGPAKGQVLVDPTVESAAFGSAMPGLEGVPALFIGDTAEPVFTVRTHPPAAAMVRASVDATLEASGTMWLSIKVADNGASPVIAQLERSSAPADVRRELGNALAAVVGRMHIDSVTLEPANGAARNATELVSRVADQRPLQEMSTSALLDGPLAVVAALAGLPRGFQPRTPPKPEDAVELQPPWATKRNANGRHSIIDADVTLHLPDNWDWTVPAPRHEVRPWLKYDLAWSRTAPREWKASMHLEVPRGEWPAAERKVRLTMMDELYTGLFSPLLLQKTPKSP